MPGDCPPGKTPYLFAGGSRGGAAAPRERTAAAQLRNVLPSAIPPGPHLQGAPTYIRTKLVRERGPEYIWKAQQASNSSKQSKQAKRAKQASKVRERGPKPSKLSMLSKPRRLHYLKSVPGQRNPPKEIVWEFIFVLGELFFGEPFQQRNPDFILPKIGSRGSEIPPTK